VISAMAVPEGDRDSASSDSGRGPSEDDFNPTCVQTTLAERPMSNGKGNYTFRDVPSRKSAFD